MTKNRLKRNTIIKMKGEYGKPKGEWLQVTRAMNYYVHAEVIKTHEKVLLSRKDVWIPNVVTLAVSKKALDEIREGKTKTIQHLITPAWKKLLEDDVFIIQFYTMHGEKVFVDIGDLYTARNCGELVVRVQIEEIIASET